MYTGSMGGASYQSLRIPVETGRIPGTGGARYEKYRRAIVQETPRYSDPDSVVSDIKDWPKGGLNYGDHNRHYNTRVMKPFRDVGSILAKNKFMDSSFAFMQSGSYGSEQVRKVSYDNPGIGFMRDVDSMGDNGHNLPMDTEFDETESFSALHIPLLNALLQTELRNDHNLTAEETLDDLGISLAGPVNNQMNGRTPSRDPGDLEEVPTQNISLEGEVPVINVWDFSECHGPTAHIELFLAMKRIHRDDFWKFGLGSYYRVDPKDTMQLPVKPMNDKYADAPYQIVSYASTDGPPPPEWTEFDHPNGDLGDAKLWYIGRVLYTQVTSVLDDSRCTLYDVSTIPSAAQLHIDYKPDEIIFK